MATAFNSTISKYLAHRLGNAVLSPAFIDTVFHQFAHIIKDTGTPALRVSFLLLIQHALCVHHSLALPSPVHLALSEGGFVPFGMSRTSFQMLGYDMLYDVRTQKVRP